MTYLYRDLSMSEPHVRETDSEREMWRSTDVLPDETRERVRKLLNEALEDMDSLDRTIDKTEADLSRLKAKREMDSVRISTLRGVISHTKKLPPEILTEVFMHLSDGSQVMLPPKKGEYQWIIGHVCSHWRRVSWSSPSVWNDIYVRDLGYENQPHMISVQHNTIQEALKHIFSNTTSLLSLTVLGNTISLIYDIIFSHRHRFKNLCLQYANWKSIFSIMELPSKSFNKLETLRISLQDSALPPLPSLNTSSFQIAPNLHSVTYSYHHRKAVPYTPNRVFIPQCLLLPWEQLTDLAISFMPIPPSELHTIFHRCLVLVSCKVLCSNDAVVPTKRLITLPFLRKLDVSTGFYHETVDWAGFTEPLITPSLTELVIRSLTVSCQAFESLITRSKCPLGTLSLQPHDIKFHDPHVESLLPHLESLTTICLGFPVAAPVIRKINGGLLPLLTYGEWVVQPDGWEAVLDLIDLRIQQRSSPEWKLGVDLVCLGGQGFLNVRDRYLRCYRKYRSIKGLHLSFWDAEMSEEIELVDEK